MKVHLTRGDIAGFVFANTTFWGSGNYRYVSVITPFFFSLPQYTILHRFYLYFFLFCALESFYLSSRPCMHRLFSHSRRLLFITHRLFHIMQIDVFSSTFKVSSSHACCRKGVLALLLLNNTKLVPIGIGQHHVIPLSHCPPPHNCRPQGDQPVRFPPQVGSVQLKMVTLRTACIECPCGSG